MKLEELEQRLKILEDSVRALQDVEEIKKLQRIYGYYLEHWQWENMIDLFSDQTESIEVSDLGVFLGKEGVRKCFRRENVPPEFLHVMMQLSGVVDVDPDGKTAKPRYRDAGPKATPRRSRAVSKSTSSGSRAGGGALPVEHPLAHGVSLRREAARRCV